MPAPRSGFRLIVALLRQRQGIDGKAAKHPIARFPRGGFETVAGALHHDPLYPQRYFQPGALLAAMDHPGIGLWGEAVMHMHGG